MDFVVLDFETANKFVNPCEIALTFVENGRIVKTKSWFIKPACFPYFNPSNIALHGITPMDVASSPEFPGVWREVRPLIEGKLVFAHYAQYDMPLLCKTIREYGLPFPNITYGCTRDIARIVFPKKMMSESNDYKPYSLGALCKTLKIKFNAHRAGEDTLATAKLALIMFEKSGVFSVNDIKSEFGISLGGIKSTGARWSPKKDKPKQKTKTPRKSSKKAENPKETEAQRKSSKRAEKRSGYVREVAAGVYRYDTFPTQQINWQKLREAEEQKEQQGKAEEWLQQQKEREQRERERQEAERQRNEEEARKRKEEWRQWRQEFEDKYENWLVAAIVGLVGLLLVIGFVGLRTYAELHNAKKELAVVKELWREQHELLAAKKQELEEQRRQEEEERQRLIAEQRQREEEERQLARQRATPNLNEEIRKSGFNNVDRFVQYGGSTTLRDELSAAERKRRDVDPLDDFSIEKANEELKMVWAKIEKEKTKIAGKTFVGNYAYSVGSVNNRGRGNSTFEMSIDTNIKHSNIAKVSFPLQNVRSDGKNLVWFHSIRFSVNGDTANIRELVNNKDSYQARVWLTNLRSELGGRAKADVIEIEIIELPEW